MLRNKEFSLFLLISGCMGAACAALATIMLSWQAGIAVGLTAALIIASAVIFTWRRYKKLEKLADYLRIISSGEYSLDVRDNEEGELSILKNEIYKVTLRLSEQGLQLQRDKSKLTDAISDISHQLKTPLTSMMMMSDLLQNMDLEREKRSEFTRNITVQLERMDWLVSSLLKLSKMDAGTLIFKKEPVLVADLVKRAAEPVAIPMEVKEQTLFVSGDEGASFLGDANWTAEALINILKNCVEHTPQGGSITITFEENPLYTMIKINDNGKGISKNDLPYIFKRFYKGENAGEDSVGIGLAMSYSIVKSQSGDIEVDSECGSGSSFCIKFYKQVI
ncbi:sensor histidine kinase [Bacillus lacus]|uniref:histidine kinase n=1 Tax=Metabacillus lacus TaxID=1983721 RepID=A0A7X2J2H7_9BACI|nr:HAMP domain-containing sensor histidine kinase [Metabacillus lacus]MRX74268.1 sensor histidine kinase [Metabacillus lacus]